ncbi:MAG: polyhydroxybutyrate depolymerase [Frankiales bacterium]|nr:polyhydroxybutyrate depolymerase [Frankiales bacterium]
MRTSRFVLPALVAAALTVVVAVVPTADVAAQPALTAASTSSASTTTTVVLRQDGTPAGSVDRPYVLTVPPGAAAARPLVVALHGKAQTLESFRSVTGLEALGEREGFVTAFPSGYGGVWNAGTCCTSRRTPDMPDVDFLDQVIADVATRTPVDLSRVHVVGFSNGAMMAYRYACQRSSAVAGVGIVSGAMAASPDYADQGAQRCRPDVPVSVVAVHGAKDTTVPYQGGAVAGSGGGSVAPARAGVDQSAVAAGCTTGSTSRVGATVRLDYTGCADGAAVRLVKISGHGHGWTRDSRKYGYDTTVGLWSFLRGRRAAAQ